MLRKFTYMIAWIYSGNNISKNSNTEKREDWEKMKKAAESIRINQVRIEDEFWTRVQEKIVDTVIPFQERVLNDEEPDVEKSHAIENFRIAAGLCAGEFYGMVFQDSDVAKWLEGAAYSLIVKPDEKLEERMDAIIGIIEKAQQPDGYLNTYFTIKEPEHRWQNLEECHELYCAGHMMEAAAAYYETTGKDRLLRVMERFADHIIARFGEGKEHGIPGHQEVEIGLMRLYHVTGKEKYRNMARYFLEERGKNPEYFYEEKRKRGWSHWGTYNPNDKPNTLYTQSHKTVYEQTEAVGHSVRAVYMYTAMADLAGADNDEKLYAACRTLWKSIVEKRMYLTGGVGSNADGEAFTIDYDLPNDMAYAETCASIGMVFFAKKMLDIEPVGEYADIMERELYNGILSGMQLDGKRFFYVNPLETNQEVSGKISGYKHVLSERPGWYSCACCPPNLVRLITSLGGYAWGESTDTIYSHLFLGQEASLDKADITVKSSYPWEGSVTYHVKAKTKDRFTIAIHIPGFVETGKDAEKTAIAVNGEQVDINSHLKEGYLYLNRIWGAEDVIEIRFHLKVRKIYTNPLVREDAGCTALMRGPVVYCFEDVDNGDNLWTLRLPGNAAPKAIRCGTGLLDGTVILKMDGYRMKSESALYMEERPQMEQTELTAIPYYAWANRGGGQMRVWVHEV